MRGKLHEVLAAKLPGRDLRYFVTQRGMFSYTGLSPAQVERLRAEHGMRVELSIQAERRVPPAAGYAIYRIAELALDNVRRHAGPCRAEVRLTSDAQGIRAEIRDDGQGFDTDAVRAHPPGTGLLLMESYTGGDHSLHLRITSSERKGTIVEILTI